MSKSDKTGGYYEYGGTQLSIQRGCEINCRYCYAKFDCVHRHKKCTAFEWAMPIIDQKKVDKNYRLFNDQPVMFPARHDITCLNVSECLTVIKRLLDAGNQVVIVSKPHWNVIPLMCEALLDYKRLITFRFTIGSTNDAALAFWEPGAAGLQERMACMQYAYHKGYQTSVSCEPYLDGFVEYVYLAVRELITESFWIGILRNFNSRVKLEGVTDEQKAKFIKPLLAVSKPAVVRLIYNSMKNEPLVRWKDSIKEIIPGAKNE
ncbi:MAG: hypothetical protein JW947_08370 [Sedimentisphaerales bacterium]|nr:hypothetical protein [Sedimentisphaerales bacterium]